MKFPWGKPAKLINYADNAHIQRPGVSGVPPEGVFGDVVEGSFTQAQLAPERSTTTNSGGLFGGIKSFFGTKAGTSYQQAHDAVSSAMALVSPWLTNVVWTVNRIFYTLAREAYGGNAVVYSCLRLLGTAVAEPPLVPHRLDSGKNRQEMDFNHPLYKLIRHPNEIMTEMSFVEMCVVHMGLVGRSHWWKERDNIGRVIGLWPLRPDRVGPLYAAQPVIAYGYSPYSEQQSTPTNVVSAAMAPLTADNRVLSGWTYYPPGWSSPIRIPRTDIMTINLLDPAGETGGVVEGLGPIQVLAREIESDNEATSFVAALLKNHAQPGAILHVKSNLMRDKAAIFKREFKRAFGGANRGDIAIFDGDTAFQEIGFNMQQLEFPNLRKVSESRIAASLGIPPVLVGLLTGVESANRSTLSEYREYFAETTLPAWWRRIQEQYTKDVATEFGDDIIVTFDTSKVKALLVQSGRQIQPYQAAFKEGVITVNEYRQNILNLPPLEGPAGNMLYVPSTSSPVDAGAEDFAMLSAGVAANYGGDAPANPKMPKVPGEKPTATPRLPGSDRPGPDSTEPASTPDRVVKDAMLKGTGVCYTCGSLLDSASKGFRCGACLNENGISDTKYVEVYSHIGDRGKPWVPDLEWRMRKSIVEHPELPKSPDQALDRKAVEDIMAEAAETVQ